MEENDIKKGKVYDYINRVLASFAEIYNYDYVEADLGKEEKIPKNGLPIMIQEYYDNHLNEEEIPTKMYYKEKVFTKKVQNEYGYIAMKHPDCLAELISLSVRILEAFGLKDLTVDLSIPEKEKEKIFNDLDVLDINYEEKKLTSDLYQNILWEIKKKKNKNEEVVLISGGNLSKKAKEIKGLEDEIIGFCGEVEDLIQIAGESLHFDEKTLDIVVTYDTESEKEHASYLTQELRLNGFKTELIKRAEKSFIKKYYNTKYVISIKEENIKKDEVILTDLYTNEKETIKELDLIDHLDINF